jgi:hypothetical protein
MKGILCACLLASLQSLSPAQAYEADIHYSTTYVLARAVGWTQADALTIASANQAVDENQDTVAALEVDTTPSTSVAGYVASSLHQAEKNLRFHCFSKTRGRAGQVSSDVRKVISGHFADLPMGGDSRRDARRLIALGVALHCQQDAHSHAGFGGSCGSYSGSCYGHTYQTFLDQMIFGLFERHYYNPDHPGVSGEQLLAALEETSSELVARRPNASLRSISIPELVALADELSRSGLDLTDEVRRDCNRYIAGKWLFEFVQSGSRRQDRPDALEKLAPEVAVTCRNASLASATIVRIPAPRFPRLNPDASPHLVRADGTYQWIRGGHFDVSSPHIHAAAVPDLIPNYNSSEVKVQLSHWSHLLSLPRLGQVALLSADNRETRKGRAPVGLPTGAFPGCECRPSGLRSSAPLLTTASTSPARTLHSAQCRRPGNAPSAPARKPTCPDSTA